MGQRHVVRPGECLSSIAAAHGSSTKALWDAAENAELRGRRSDPNLLKAGDVVVIPDRAATPFEAATGSTHRFVHRRERVTLRLRLIDEHDDHPAEETRITVRGSETRYEEPEPRPARDRALGGARYLLQVGSRVLRGKTDDDGVLERTIPADVDHARLIIEPETERERVLDLRIGHLDPLDEVSGVKQRLYNLGFFPGEPSDDETAELREALAAFQHKYGLDVTGRLDAATRDRLRTIHRS